MRQNEQGKVYMWPSLWNDDGWNETHFCCLRCPFVPFVRSSMLVFIHFSCLAQSLMIVLKTIACSIHYVHCRPHFCSLHTILQYYICSSWTFAEYFSILSLSARCFTFAICLVRSLVFMSLLLPNWVNEQGLVGVCISHLYVQRTGLQSKLV